MEKFPTNKINLNFYNQKICEVAEHIRSDLEDLFNTPQFPLSLPSQFLELIPSLIDYGIPLYLAYEVTTENERIVFCRTLENIISLYETQLQNVKVSHKKDNEENSEVLSIFIQAEINLGTGTEPLAYELLLNTGLQDFVVSLTRT